MILRPRHRMAARSWLFVVTAVLELGAALALLAVPAVIIGVVFGSRVDVLAAAGLARLAGAALLSLAAACWWARHDLQSAASRALVGALLIYNGAVVALIIAGALGALGPLQWAVMVLHGVMAIWCVWIAPFRVRGV